MDVTSAVLAMVPKSMNAAGFASWDTCALTAASFDRKIWKLPSTPIHPGRRQRWSCRLRMPEQAATQGGFLRGMRFQLFHVLLRVVELEEDCAGLRNRKVQRRSGTGYA
jgi:hypothetical protein